jgi:hypothetical protein
MKTLSHNSLGTSRKDNNDSLGFHGGVGLNLLDGKLAALATTHIGPETRDDKDSTTRSQFTAGIDVILAF